MEPTANKQTFIEGAVDKLVATFAPSWGLKRQRARSALVAMQQRAYDGAKTGRRTAGWTTGATSADGEIAQSIGRLRDRSRDVIRNNPYAQRAQDIFATNIVGTGIVAKAVGMQSEWDTWCRQCDADGLLDFYGIQALVARSLFESGEVLVRFLTPRQEAGMAVPLVLQVLEPDYLDTSRAGKTSDGGWIASGIEYNAAGVRAAYWLWNQHPGDSGRIGQSLTSHRVPAADVLHIFERKRGGQNRGVPRLASVLLKMRDLDDYEEAELVRKGVESCFAAFVSTSDEGQTVGPDATGSDGRRIESLSAGMIQYLRPGQEITFGTPQTSGGYGDYTKTQLRAIAAGIGLTYEQLTGDLTGVNYSSIRAGMVEFARTVESVQWLTLVPMLLDPVWQRWSEVAYGVRAVKVKPPETVRWTPPRRQWVDPLKDVNAARQEIAGAITSLSETIRGRGEDPEKILAEIAEERALLKRLGIVSDVVEIPAPPPALPDPTDQAAKRATLALLRAQTAAQERAITGNTDARIAELSQKLIGFSAEVRALRDAPQPAAPAPVFHIAAPNVEVKVDNIMPEQSEISIVSMPDRLTSSEIVRNASGDIVKTTQTETDADQTTGGNPDGNP